MPGSGVWGSVPRLLVWGIAAALLAVVALSTTGVGPGRRARASALLVRGDGAWDTTAKDNVFALPIWEGWFAQPRRG
jgi:hypothetical protein